MRVATGFYPLAYVAQRVGGDLVEVTNLTQPGAEPHDLELTIKETVAISQADIVVYEQGFQPATQPLRLAHVVTSGSGAGASFTGRFSTRRMSSCATDR